MLFITISLRNKIKVDLNYIYFDIINFVRVDIVNDRFCFEHQKTYFQKFFEFQNVFDHIHDKMFDVFITFETFDLFQNLFYCLLNKILHVNWIYDKKCLSIDSNLFFEFNELVFFQRCRLDCFEAKIFLFFCFDKNDNRYLNRWNWNNEWINRNHLCIVKWNLIRFIKWIRHRVFHVLEFVFDIRYIDVVIRCRNNCLLKSNDSIEHFIFFRIKRKKTIVMLKLFSIEKFCLKKKTNKIKRFV